MAQLIKSTGETLEVKPKDKKFTLEEVQQLIEARWIEHFKAGNKTFIWDENGRNRKLPTNEKATDLLYLECEGMRNVQDIVGHVLVVEENEI